MRVPFATPKISSAPLFRAATASGTTDCTSCATNPNFLRDKSDLGLVLGEVHCLPDRTFCWRPPLVANAAQTLDQTYGIRDLLDILLQPLVRINDPAPCADSGTAGVQGRHARTGPAGHYSSGTAIGRGTIYRLPRCARWGISLHSRAVGYIWGIESGWPCNGRGGRRSSAPSHIVEIPHHLAGVSRGAVCQVVLGTLCTERAPGAPKSPPRTRQVTVCSALFSPWIGREAGTVSSTVRAHRRLTRGRPPNNWWCKA